MVSAYICPLPILWTCSVTGAAASRVVMHVSRARFSDMAHIMCVLDDEEDGGKL